MISLHPQVNDLKHRGYKQDVEENDTQLGVYVVFGALCDVIVDGLEFVEDILDRLHHDGLQRACKRVRIVCIVLFQHECRFCLLRHLAARLTLQHKVRDGERVRGCRSFALRRIVVLLSDVMK